MILTVTGGKGGVGKTTIAYNLGSALDAVVIDADLGMADLPASRGPDLHDVLAGLADPLEAVHEEGPVALLPCGRTLAGARGADPPELIAVVDAVRAEYDRVVIDSPAGMRCDVGLPLLASEACLLVTRPTRPALADAIRTRELARVIETPLACVALNRVDVSQDNTPDERTRRIANTLGAPVTELPESRVVARAQRSGLPVCSIAPDSPACKQVNSLAETVERVV